MDKKQKIDGLITCSLTARRQLDGNKVVSKIDINKDSVKNITKKMMEEKTEGQE